MPLELFRCFPLMLSTVSLSAFHHATKPSSSALYDTHSQLIRSPTMVGNVRFASRRAKRGEFVPVNAVLVITVTVLVLYPAIGCARLRCDIILRQHRRLEVADVGHRTGVPRNGGAANDRRGGLVRVVGEDEITVRRVEGTDGVFPDVPEFVLPNSFIHF